MKNTLTFGFIAVVFFLSSCIRKDEPNFLAMGMRPNYIPLDSLLHFSQEAPRDIVDGTKIAYYQNYMFMVDHNRGIHVIDLTDPNNPIKASFLSIPGNQDVTLTNGYLYADNGPHLLILDISDLSNIRLIERRRDAFSFNLSAPVGHRGYFECPDPSQGWVVGWDSIELVSPRCRN